jgi:hypothetical protein
MNDFQDAQDISTDNQLTGVWRSDYTYNNSDRGADFQSQHYVRMYPKGGELVIESVPNANESYLVARFWLDGDVATGSWQEITSLKGDYEGTIYHGAAQLIVDKDRKHLKGKWVGFGKKMEVKTGPWEFTYLGKDESALPEGKRAGGQ